MRKLSGFIFGAVLLFLAVPARAQICVGYSGGKFATCTNGASIASLNGSNISTGTVADARLATILSGHTITSGTLGNALAGGGFKITGLAQGTASGEALTAARAVLAGTGLSVTNTGLLTADITFSVTNTAVSASSYPSTGQISTFTVNAQGQLTSAGSSTDGSGLTGVLASSASVLTVTGKTIWATPAAGQVGYVSANNTFAKAKADATGTSDALCIYQGTSGSCVTSGATTCFLDASLTLAAGDVLYLSATNAGQFTTVAPSSAGQFVNRIARLMDTTSYNSGAGSAQSCVFIPSGIIVSL